MFGVHSCIFQSTAGDQYQGGAKISPPPPGLDRVKLRQFEILPTWMDDVDGDEALTAISASPVSLQGAHMTLEAQST
jgi:hypothetical protein